MAAKPVKEIKIEDYLVKEINKAFPEAECFKFELVRRGEADRLFLLPNGRAVFVEVKRPGEKLRDDQKRAMTRKQNNGFLAYWVNTKEAVDLLILTLQELYTDKLTLLRD